MKKSYSFVIAALFAALMTVPSCSYLDEPDDNENTGIEAGVRTINLCFPQTKTVLNGYQPEWSEGDEILLVDDYNEEETYTVTAKDAGRNQFTIATRLTGTITAVYPKSAAVREGKKITGVMVSQSQNGSFANANICMATEDGSSNLMFKNQTAVIKVKVPAGTKKLTVTSLGKIGGDGQRGKLDENRTIINSATVTDAYSTVVTPVGEFFDGDSCFVSILVDKEKALYLTDLNFDVEYTVSSTTHYAQGGFSPLSIKAAGFANPYTYEVKKNDLHTLAASSLHEYVVVGEGDNARKWATKNVGATESNPNGDYFAWGATEVAYESLTNKVFTFKTGKPASYVYSNGYTGPWTPGSGFAVCNTPYYDGLSGNDAYSNSKYNKGEGKKVLDLEDDAANANWGGSWRMPTNEEYEALINTTSTTESNFSSSVLTINGHSDLTFPVAGYGNGTDLKSVSDYGDYWSSSVRTEDPSSIYAWCLDFSSRSAGVNRAQRFYGHPVRPFSE